MVAAIAFGIPPEGVFTEVLSVARAGASRETDLVCNGDPHRDERTLLRTDQN